MTSTAFFGSWIPAYGSSTGSRTCREASSEPRIRGWLTDVFDHFESGRVDCSDIRDLGDRVLALGTVYGTGRGSGVEVALPYTVVARVENGLVTEFIDYGDKEQALQAAGLDE